MPSTSSTVARRADAEIFADARGALDRNPHVPGTVHVHVEQGVATLTGNVRLPAERAEAVRAIHGVEGIHSLVNKIIVTQRVDPDELDTP